MGKDHQQVSDSLESALRVRGVAVHLEVVAAVELGVERSWIR